MNMPNQFQEFLPAWIRIDGEASDVVISSRIRLARNLKGFPFPSYADESQLAGIADSVMQALKRKSALGEFLVIKLAELNPKERLILVEKHLCSPHFIEQQKSRFLLVNQEQSVSIMVNEEDHLRIQTMTPGFFVAGSA